MANASPGSSALRGASILVLLQVLSRLLTFVANQLLLRFFLTAPLLGAAARLELYYLTVVFFARESLRVALLGQGQQVVSTTEEDSGGRRKRKSESKSEGESEGEGERKGKGKSKSKNESRGQGEGEVKDGHGGAAQSRSPKDASTTDTAVVEARRRAQTLANLAQLSLPMGLVTALLFARVFFHSSSTTTIINSSSPTTNPLVGPTAALPVYALAALLELASEPAFAVLSARQAFGARAAAETLGGVVRCVVALGSALWLSSVARTVKGGSGSGAEVGVAPLALGQLAYGAVVLVVYLVVALPVARCEGWSLLWPRRVLGPAKTAMVSSRESSDGYVVWGRLHLGTLRLAASLTAQSVLKHFLTQGDTMLVSALADPAQQGVYALANNYGGLLARLLFQPVEESCRAWFSRVLTGVAAPAVHARPSKESKTSVSTEKGGDGDGAGDGTGAGAGAPSLLAHATTTLGTIFHVYALLSLPVLALAPAASPALLQLVAGSRWTAAGAGRVLAAYSAVLPLLAINGVSEAVVSSAIVSSTDAGADKGVRSQGVAMTVFAGVFAGSAWALVRLAGLPGGVALVAANGVAMAGRIAWSLAFLDKWWAERRGGSLSRAVGVALWPGSLAVAAAVAAGAVAQRVVGSATGADGVVERPVLVLAKLVGVSVPLLLTM